MAKGITDRLDRRFPDSLFLLTEFLSVIFIFNHDFHLRYRKDGAGRGTC